MIPEADDTAARPYQLENRPSVVARRGTCTVCSGNVGEDNHVSVCESCLLGLPLEPAAPYVCHAPEESQPTQQATLTLGPYVLLEEIGRGGQGVVYRALHRSTNEVFAVKTVLPQELGCPETLTRFQREAAAAQGLDHPNTMPVREVGCSVDGIPYFSMDLAVGGSLHQLKAKYRGRWRQTAELMVKISEAVHHAHQQGILHRDLKPGNILFTEEHEPFVTDFGLAKQLTSSAELTQSCAVLGTPNYVSPEQAAGRTKDLTVASDVYSLGAILYELLTGRPPFTGDNPLHVLQQVAISSPERPRRLVRAIPQTLEAICMRCLERDRLDRYTSAHALAHDLRSWLRGDGISYLRLDARLRRSVRRRWVFYVWGLGAIIALSVIWVTWISLRKPLRSLEHVISIAVAVEDFDQDPFLTEAARRTVASLENELSRATMFQLQDSGASNAQPSHGILDAIARGRAINAKIMLAGSLRRCDNQVRFTARLLRCDTGAIIWRHAEILPSDEFASKMSVATESISELLQARWRAAPSAFTKPTCTNPSPASLAFYTRAKELAARKTLRDLDAAASLLRQAIQSDSDFAAARAMLAYTLWVQADGFGELDKLPLAIATAKEALTLDPDSAQAHRVIASGEMKAARYPQALEEFWRAVEIDPQSAGCCQSLGVCLRRSGHPDLAIHWLQRAVELEPAHASTSGTLGEALSLCGRDAEAQAAYERAINLDGDQPELQIDLSALKTWQKQYDEARRLCAQVRLRFPATRFGLSLSAWIEFCDGKSEQAETCFEKLRAENSYQQNWIFYGGINPSSALAYLASRSGSITRVQFLAEEALRIDRELLNKSPRNARVLHDLAATYSVIGNKEKALNYLEEAAAAGWIEGRSTKIDPRFLALASLPRFEKILGKTCPIPSGR